MRRFLAILALLVAGCGGSTDSGDGPATIAFVYSSPYAPSWPGSLAYTHVIEGTAYIHVRDDIDPAITPIWPIIAHELWHAAGFAHHLADPCVAAPNASNADNGPPCDEELVAMAGVPGVISIRAQVAIHRAANDAIDYWNTHLGRTLFRMGQSVPNP